MTVEFYKFSSSSETWLYTSAKQPITYLSEVYLPIAISRNKLNGLEDVATANLEITGGLDNAFFQLCDNSDLEEAINVIVYSKENTDVSIIFRGVLTKCSPTETNYVLTFSSIFSQQGRSGVGVQVQGNCPYALYGFGCFKDKTDMQLTGVISSISGNILMMSAAATKADGWFTGGFIEDTNGNPRFIIDHVGNQLTLTKPLNSLNTTDTFSIFAGCDRAISTCLNKFDNIDNYGGRPQVPRISPYTIILSN